MAVENMENTNAFPRDFKGVWIPREVWLDDRLSALDKIILVEIDSLDCGEEGCYASNKYLAEFCQCSEAKITKSISKLVNFGYLEVVGFNGRRREIKSLLSKIRGSLVKSTRQTSKKYEAESEKVRGYINNIENNIDNYLKKEIKKERSSKREKKSPCPKISDTVDNKTKITSQSKNNFDDAINVIENYTNNQELREELRNHLEVRKRKKASLDPDTIKSSLKKLDKISDNDEEKILIVQNAVISGWIGFWSLSNNEKKLVDKKKTKGKPSYDLEDYEDFDILS